MGILTTTDKVSKLRTKSANAIGIFQKTVSDLSSTNDEIAAEQKIRDDKVLALNEEIEELQIIRDQNQSFITKLNQFLGLEE